MAGRYPVISHFLHHLPYHRSSLLFTLSWRTRANPALAAVSTPRKCMGESTSCGDARRQIRHRPAGRMTRHADRRSVAQTVAGNTAVWSRSVNNDRDARRVDAGDDINITRCSGSCDARGVRTAASCAGPADHPAGQNASGDGRVPDYATLATARASCAGTAARRGSRPNR